MKNNLFLDALHCKPVKKIPVWFMRQAGRYLPEYREIRAKAGSFMNLCRTPELACEVTLQPIRRFGFDAAILFSDILIIADAMGLSLQVLENRGPVFSNTVRSATDINQLKIPDPTQELKFTLDAIQLIAYELRDQVPLIGFAGSPWTVATYMVEGEGTKSFSFIKKMMYQAPQLLHQLLNKLAQSTAIYLAAQVKAGAEAIMLFDTWGGILSPENYQEFSLRYMKAVMDELTALHCTAPVILFGKQTHQHLEGIAATGCTGIGVDWTISLIKARERVGKLIALQGNLDPAVLYASPDIIVSEIHQLLATIAKHPGYIFNLGHGILPDINPDHVKIAVDTVHDYKII